MRFIILLFLLALLVNNLTFGQNNFTKVKASHEECTIGVASGTATSDGRPMVWKSRDYTSAKNNVVKYISSFPIKFISVFTVDSANYSRMGVNEHGFAIVNSYSTDLPPATEGPINGELMRDVLGYCVTVEEFQDYLDSTNITGRMTRGNFAVIDSTGAAAIFELADTLYWRFDAADSQNGYLIRTNFTTQGGGSAGVERYERSSKLIGDFYSGDSLNYKSILRYQMRDFSDSIYNTVPVPYPGYWQVASPYGYINTDKSICRYSTVSAAVIQGVLPVEQAALSTMWTILGQPASSVALPYWPVGEPPVETSGTPNSALCDLAIDIRTRLFDDLANKRNIDSYKLLNGVGGGLWSCTLPLEDIIFTDVEYYLENMRTNNSLQFNSMLEKETQLVDYALSELNDCYYSQIINSGEIDSSRILSVFPNPFVSKTNVEYYLSEESNVRIEIYSLTGKKMATLCNSLQTEGKYIRRLDADDYSAGVYFVRIYINSQMDAYKLVKLSN